MFIYLTTVLIQSGQITEEEISSRISGLFRRSNETNDPETQKKQKRETDLSAAASSREPPSRQRVACPKCNKLLSRADNLRRHDLLKHKTDM